MREMGQKVKGYQRNAEAKARRGSLARRERRSNNASGVSEVSKSKQEGQARKRGRWGKVVSEVGLLKEGGKAGSVEGGMRSWNEEVNPPYKYGWEKSGVERSEKEYGKNEGLGQERRRRVEEVLLGEGYETNGRGRKGSRKQGYVVYGEYVKALVGVSVARSNRKGKKEVGLGETKKGRKGRARGRAPVRGRRQQVQVGKGQERRGRGSSPRACEAVRGGSGVKKGVASLGVRASQGLQGKWEKLNAKRGRRRRRYESEVGRKVKRERVNLAEVRKRVGRRPERKRRGKVMGSGERGKREKRTVVGERGQQGEGSSGREERDKGGSSTEKGGELRLKGEGRGKEVGLRRQRRSKKRKGRREETRRASKKEKEVMGEEGVAALASREVGVAEQEQQLEGRRKRRKPEKRKVSSKGRGVVMVLSGVRKRERRRVKRRVRKRERAGRKHKKARRDFVGRMKYQARKSKYGRKGLIRQSGGAKHFGRGSSGLDAPQARGGKEQQGMPGYYGYKVTVVGTLDGGRRTKKMVMWRGTVPKSTKGARRGSAEGVAKTSVGTMGVRVEYCYELG